MAFVKFWYGAEAAYTSVTPKDTNTLYFITDSNGGIFKGETKIAELSASAVAAITQQLGDIAGTGYADVATGLNALKNAVTVLNSDKEVAGSVAHSIDAAIAALKLDETYDAKGSAAAVLGSESDNAEAKTVYGVAAAVAAEKARAEAAEKVNADAITAEVNRAKAAEGDLETLDTTAKTNLVSAINEVKEAVEAGSTAAAITLSTETTSDGALKSYTLKQGEDTVGVIDIPKDMVVESGEVVVNPEGQAEGTYIKLVLANVADPLYINVGTLVDIYKAKANAAQVQVAIDSATREISATIVAGSIGATELAANAVTTAKIADGNVTKAKLSTTVQESLNLADSALQKADITTGGANGTIAVEGEDVAVKGLGSAAFVATETFDAAGSAAAVQNAFEPRVAALEAAMTWQTA